MGDKSVLGIPDRVSANWGGNGMTYSESKECGSKEKAAEIAMMLDERVAQYKDTFAAVSDSTFEMETKVWHEADTVKCRIDLDYDDPEDGRLVANCIMAIECMAMISLVSPDMWELVVDSTDPENTGLEDD
mgnify:CR=1 FL=1